MQLTAEILNWISTLIVAYVIASFVPGCLRFASGHGRFYDPLRALFAYVLAVRLWYQGKNYAWPHPAISPAELINQIGANSFSLIGVGLMVLIIRGYEKTDAAS